ncbi:hypothetical protein SmJEL517_g00354 [Synchytrium microbalum]|uniref:Mitotic-spindle organizing protein 1 n=1 Tax=Synchytrium microbalum TaxID=1806994 RepID=A0A507CK04_9FUNG|nr:uncharacterized protein SmJEL517_g00354 [Synchytrium microbalum]TPX38123.1 hypothetical protein SmJEL517_g00354 [Synchytrium microbalum]
MQASIPQVPESLLQKSVDAELYDLAASSGLIIRQDVFKIILELVRLNVPPTAIVDALRDMAHAKKQ